MPPASSPALPLARVCAAAALLLAPAIGHAQSAAEGETWIFNRLDRLGRHPTSILGEPKLIESPLGKAIEFDGVDDAIYVDAHPLAGAMAFTWEVIFRPDSGGGAEQRFFHLQEQDPRTKTDTQTRMLFETRLIGAQWCLDAFVNSGPASHALLFRDRLHPLDRWYHIAMVYDGREFRSYVNGELQGKIEIRFEPQGAGRSSVGTRINRRDYFKGAVRLSRFTPRALEPREFLPPPK